MRESGQAIFEYILMITLALGVVISIGSLFRRSLGYFSQVMTCEVSAPCPGCPPREEVRNRIYPGACKAE